jgi:hypothetical protein
MLIWLNHLRSKMWIVGQYFGHLIFLQWASPLIVGCFDYPLQIFGDSDGVEVQRVLTLQSICQRAVFDSEVGVVEGGIFSN